MTMPVIHRSALRLHLWIFVSLLLFFIRAYSYFPGIAPGGYWKGDLLKVKMDELTSTKTQILHSYYSLPYCKPNKIVGSAENLVEVHGDRFDTSPYVFKMREPQMCNVVCRVVLDAKTAKEFKEKMDDEYRVNMILDDLPLVHPIHFPIHRPDQELFIAYEHGFPVGLKALYDGSTDGKYFIYNHLAFTVKFHEDLQTDTARIVGFKVKPFSVKHVYEGEWSDKTRLTTCDPHTKQADAYSESPQEVEDNKEIIFTYDVEFQESNLKWASRWDTYLVMADVQHRWFSIFISFLIVLFLSGIVAMIMLRTLCHDISKYNQLETQEEAQEETGWKLVHADVFRPPRNSDLLCVYVGTGVQFFGMVLATMMFTVLGFLSPSNRDGSTKAMLMLWVFMGLFAGYSSARICKMFKGKEWKKVTLKTALMFPGTIFALFSILNALISGEKSSGTVSFGTMFALVVLWLGASVPLVFVGAYVGFKKPALEDPVKTNKTSRPIPKQPCLDASCLCHLQFPLHRLPHPDHHLRRDHYCALLLPALQRGLQLVVEVLPDFRIIGTVPVPLCHLLLPCKASDNKASGLCFVLWLHADCLLWFLRAHWYSRLLCMFLVHQAHLLIFEG